MEDALAHVVVNESVKAVEVLILVVMEDALAHIFLQIETLNYNRS